MSKRSWGESGWQYGKTALECHRYMLDNEIATDVCFVVGPPDAAAINIRAHKYMLISRSPVFEAMFSSGMTECKNGPEEKIRIEDIDPDVFKELLRFIYCDQAKITSASALELMYAAKKYMLPNVVQLCSDCLQNDLTTENVCLVLNQSLLFEELQLKQKCLDLIVENSLEVLKPKNLQNASRQTMEVILRLDSLAEDETLIYEACINWAKMRLKSHKSIESPNDRQIREMLGDLIYEIRFPTMDATAFVKLVEDSSVLSYEEQSAILCYFVNQHKRETMKFNSKARLYGDRCVDRGGRNGSMYWESGPSAIDLKVDRKVLVTGLGLLPEKDANGSGYTVDVEILKASVSLFKMSTFVPCTGNSTPYKVAFQTPIILDCDILYTIVANSRTGRHLYWRDYCRPICTKDNITFTFSTTDCKRYNGTDHTQGQIPQIYFKIPMFEIIAVKTRGEEAFAL